MKLTNIFSARAIIVMFATDNNNNQRYSSDRRYEADEVYFEFAEVHNNIPGALTPLSDAAADSFSKALSTFANSQIGGFISEKVMYCGITNTKPNVMWYTPPQKKKLQYNIDDEFKLKKSEIYVPWLLWHYVNEDLYLFALMDKPTIKSRLFKAPFGNIDEKGCVCLGAGTSVTSKDFTTFDELINLVELAFWGTRFTHQSDNTLKDNKNLITVHMELNGTNNPFPVDLLKGTSKIVKSLVDDKSKFGEEETS